MGRIRIRKASESDYTQIFSIDKEFFKNFPWNDDAEIWTAIIDMEVVGFSYVWSLETLPEEGLFESFLMSISGQRYKGESLQGKKIFICSPIYLCKKWQKGIYRRLLERIKIFKKYDYDLGLTFVHFDDSVTLSEYIKEYGMSVLRPFFHDDHGYNVVCFNLNSLET